LSYIPTYSQNYSTCRLAWQPPTPPRFISFPTRRP